MVDGKKCDIVWYIDDNKLLHVDPNVVTDILEEIKNQCGDLDVSRGDTHDFLGITITIKKYNKVDIMMKHKIEYTVSQFKDTCDLR